MNEQGTSQPSAAAHTHERCLCCEIVGTLQSVLAVPPEAKQHLTNSRVEFLKALRALIDNRIAHVSGAAQQGTNISVE